jgi:iron(III) transport system substrate-binding protein
MVKLLTGLGALVLAALALVCGPAHAQTDYLTNSSPDRASVLEEGARKEGSTLMFYSALTVDQGLRAVVDGFTKKYPWIKTEYWRGTEAQIVQKVLAEQRANQLVVDIIESVGVAAALERAKATVAFKSPYAAAIPARYQDPANLSAASRLNFFGLAFNTKLVPPGSEPKTYDDLLDPKWKGKIAWRVESVSGAQLFIINMLLTRGEKDGEEYLKKLATQEIVTFTGSARTLVNRVMEGEYPAAINIFIHHPVISAGQGAPVGARLMEPVPSIAGTLVIPKGVKHPATAMLFMDFFLSEAGQNVMRDAEYFPVIESVKPLKSLESVTPALVGAKEHYISDKQLLEMEKKADAIYKRYFR